MISTGLILIVVAMMMGATSVTPAVVVAGVTPTSPQEEPTDTSVPPTDTSVPPTDTSVPPTDTSVPPTETSASPTETPEPTKKKKNNNNNDQPTSVPQPAPTETPAPVVVTEAVTVTVVVTATPFRPLPSTGADGSLALPAGVWQGVLGVILIALGLAWRFAAPDHPAEGS